MEDSNLAFHSELSKKLLQYVQKKFISDKVTVDEYSISLFYKLMRRLFFFYKDLESPIVSVDFKLNKLNSEEYDVSIHVVTNDKEEIELHDENLSKSVGNMFGKELIKAKEKGLRFFLKNVEDFEKKINEKTKRKD